MEERRPLSLTLMMSRLLTTRTSQTPSRNWTITISRMRNQTSRIFWSLKQSKKRKGHPPWSLPIELFIMCMAPAYCSSRKKKNVLRGLAPLSLLRSRPRRFLGVFDGFSYTFAGRNSLLSMPTARWHTRSTRGMVRRRLQARASFTVFALSGVGGTKLGFVEANFPREHTGLLTITAF